MASGLSAGLKASFPLGVGPEANYRFHDLFSLSGGLHWLDFDFDFTADSTDYDGAVDFLAFGLRANYHPFRGAFHISAGALSNQNEASIVARPDQDGKVYTINDVEYAVNDVGALTGTVTFNDLAGYLGIGWGHGKDSRFGLLFDLGVVFQGSPKIDLEASGPIATLEPLFREDLEREEEQVQEELDPYKYLPVVALGFFFRF